MSRANFSRLVELVRFDVTRDVRMGSLRNGVIEAEIRVAIFVRILAGASDNDGKVGNSVETIAIFAIAKYSHCKLGYDVT